jgi:hypothetical protein
MSLLLREFTKIVRNNILHVQYTTQNVALNFDTGWWCVVSFGESAPIWTLWEKKNFLPWPGNEPQFHCNAACSQVAIPAEPSLLVCHLKIT